MNLQFNLCRSRNYLACGTTSHKWAVRYQLREWELMNVRLDFYGHLCCENNQTSERGVLEWQRVINKTSNDWIWMANENPAATSASKVTLCAFIESSHICHWRRNPCPVHLPGSFTATARFCFFLAASKMINFHFSAIFFPANPFTSCRMKIYSSFFSVSKFFPKKKEKKNEIRFQQTWYVVHTFGCFKSFILCLCVPNRTKSIFTVEKV